MFKRTWIASGALIFFAVPIVALAAGSTFSYGGWLPFWKKQSGAWDTAINLDKLHEISPFSYEVNSNGTLVDRLKLSEGFWPGWLAAARDLNVKIIPTIALFDGKALHRLLSNKKRRIAHEDAIAALVVKQNFDGIDIDYEAKLPETKDYFSTFLQGLALRLHPKKKILSCTIEARMPLASLYEKIPATVPRANDYVALNKYCDHVRVMAYDQGVIDWKLNAQKGSGQLYAPVADGDWVEKVLQEAVKTINRKKVVLAIPTYGYEYQVSWANGVTKYERLRSHTYFQAMDRSEAVNATPLRNSAGELSYVYATSTYTNGVSSALTWSVASPLPSSIAAWNTSSSVARFVSFSDSTSIAHKIALAKKFGLRGAVLFKLDGEQDPLMWEVMK